MIDSPAQLGQIWRCREHRVLDDAAQLGEQIRGMSATMSRQSTP
jgi:hypothetical protein